MTATITDPDQIDPMLFRQVLGCHATGVAVITAIATDGQPVGMAVTSFTSISLDPPLVAFCPDKRSSTWPRMEAAGRFCVNLLAEEQETVCRTFATPGADKFANLDYQVSPHGLPLIPDALATIECDVHAVLEGGDHWIVLGRVRAMQARAEGKPLLFFRSAYSQVSSV